MVRLIPIPDFIFKHGKNPRNRGTGQQKRGVYLSQYNEWEYAVFCMGVPAGFSRWYTPALKSSFLNPRFHRATGASHRLRSRFERFMPRAVKRIKITDKVAHIWFTKSKVKTERVTVKGVPNKILQWQKICDTLHNLAKTKGLTFVSSGVFCAVPQLFVGALKCVQRG